MSRPFILASLLIGAAALASGDAHACGCFAPPDPSVPIVQAGERILFAIDSGQVTAAIQIQYQGDAQDFGWLLPLPSVPTLELGVDELFNDVTNVTQPKYELTRNYEGNCAWLNFGGAGGVSNVPGVNGGSEDGGGSTGGVLVIQSSIGPYDYAVLHAESKDDMFNWLTDNHYFIPAGTDDAVGPYIHPGAYFLALKLRSGASAGDLQPVVVKYASDLAMIPLVLTSVGAKPDMGIQVWMLGDGRAIPHNYYHTVLDDAVIDWLNAGTNYQDVVIAATKEAPGRHTFVTEYAGSSSVMLNQLDYAGRFGDLTQLAVQSSPLQFVQYMNQTGWTSGTNNGPPNFGAPTYSTQVLAVLGKYIPVPPGLATQNVTPSQFYGQIGYYLTSYEQQNPQDFVGWQLDYRPAAIVADLQTVVVDPTRAAAALFTKYPYLTRLYTTLSPGDMNKDPVFSYNHDLPAYSNVHGGTLTYHCGVFSDSPQTTPATLETENGFVVQYPHGTGQPFKPTNTPYSQRIEVLSEEGAPTVYADFTSQIDSSLGHSGCQIAFGGAHPLLGGTILAFILGAALLVRRRTR